ncbi:hypothetical protein JQC79_10635 [Ochrobactrum anthropi]|uniref:hyaluronate lyase N-terminal domain-containing protein n=1 Tax=Brucella anthropi TaxID=529 RepID=UPI00195022E9|nr:hypothetical protein [Brucella anthropi]MBM6396205.1 hypothetical protein [Brucella anthropi]
MATEVRWRRGTAAQHESFVGAMSEVTHDTTNNSLRLHDGSTLGGHETVMQREKGAANGFAPLDEDRLVPEEFLLNAPVGDGSVTDPKLPGYDPVNSPSAAKIRFLASTSAGAIAGAVSRPLNEKLSESLHVADFGVKADGVSNDTVAFLSAWAAAKSTHRPLFADAGTIMIDPDVWEIGTQENGVAFFGASSSPYMQQGTILKARVSGDVMFKINGFSEGHCLSGFTIDCDGKVKNAHNIETCSNFTISRFSLLNFTEYGMKFSCITPANGLVSWSSNFTIEDFFIQSDDLKDYGAGLYMSGTMDTASPPGPADPHLFTFRQGRIQVNKGVVGPTRGGDFGFVDSGQFYEVDFVGSGGGTMFQPTAFRTTNNPGEPFPANLSFYSCSMQGGTIFSDDLHGRIYMAHFTTGDGEVIPEGLRLLFGFTDHGHMFGDWSIERLSAELLFYGDTAAKRRIRFSTPDGSQQTRITHNASLGLEVEMWTGSAWLLVLRLYADGQIGMNFPGVGFRILGAGSPDSGGSGRRSISIPN